MKKLQKKRIRSFVILVYFIFLFISFLLGLSPGEKIAGNFFSFSIEMLKILPCAFILIGLFEVWVKKEKVEKYLGRESGFVSHVWAILLAGATVGGLYVAFPGGLFPVQ